MGKALDALCIATDKLVTLAGYLAACIIVVLVTLGAALMPVIVVVMFVQALVNFLSS